MVLSFLCFIIIDLKHMEIQITAIKFETVNGKKTGKSFSFKADPKKLAVFKTEATLKKKRNGSDKEEKDIATSEDD